jgi:hypothetical protein
MSSAAKLARRRLQQQAEIQGMPTLPSAVSAALGTLQTPVSVECHDDVVSYEFGDRHAADAPSTLLFEFMALAEGSASDVGSFARRFSVLGLCREHGLPFGHSSRSGNRYADLAEGADGVTSQWHELFEAIRAGRYDERIEDWRAWARRFRLLFDRANALKGATRSAALLDEIFLRGDRPQEAVHSRGPLSSRSTLWEQVARVLNQWLQDAGAATLVVSSKGGPPEIHLSAHTPFAFPVLVRQLLLFVTGAQEEATCKACGRLYLPKRRPQKGRDTYCPTCGRKAANRAAIRRFREQPKKKRRTT